MTNAAIEHAQIVRRPARRVLLGSLRDPMSGFGKPMSAVIGAHISSALLRTVFTART